MTTALTTTLEQSRQEGFDAAISCLDDGDTTPSMLTAEGADEYRPSNPYQETNVSDVAYYCFRGGGSSHCQEVSAINDEALDSFGSPRALAAAWLTEMSEEQVRSYESTEEALSTLWCAPPPSMQVDWDDEHYDAFLEGFEAG